MDTTRKKTKEADDNNSMRWFEYPKKHRNQFMIYTEEYFLSSARRCNQERQENCYGRAKGFVNNHQQIHSHLQSLQEEKRGYDYMSIGEKDSRSHEVIKALVNDQKKTRLFYPGAGADFYIPLKYLSPYVDEFYFADPGATILRDEPDLLISTLESCGIECRDYKQLRHNNIAYTQLELTVKGRNVKFYYFHTLWQDAVAWMIEHHTKIHVFYVFDTGGEGGVDFWCSQEFINDVCIPVTSKRFILYGGSVQYGTLEARAERSSRWFDR